MKEALIIGAGNWGTTIAALLSQKSECISQFVRNPEQRSLMTLARENTRYLPGITLPQSLKFPDNLEAAVEKADLLIFATPTNSTRPLLKDLQELIRPDQVLLSLAKGIEINTGFRVSEIFHEVLGTHRQFALLSGPNIASEIALNKPAITAVASSNPAVSRKIQEFMSTPSFRVYTNPDLTGLEVCGALKNIIAIGAGICHQLELGDNAIAALITRGIAEIARFGQAFGANQATFMGMAGVGDLTVTCMSPLSRNNKLGRLLAQRITLEEAREQLQMVAEGAFTCKIVNRMAQEHKIYMPITEAIHRILFDSIPVEQALQSLMESTLKDEIVHS